MQRETTFKNEEITKAAEELKSYCTILREAEEAKHKADEYKERYDYGQRARAYDGLCVDEGTRHDAMVDTVITWADLDLIASQKQQEAEKRLWWIRRKLDRLSSTDRDLLDLYYIKRWSNAEIARILKYSGQWVKWAKVRALKAYAELEK